MKKIFFLILGTFLSISSLAQKKCYCELTENNGKFAKKVFEGEGEFLTTVPQNEELWVIMNPAAPKNTLENGGCRLKPGEQYVATLDINGTLIPRRAWKCGNQIISYSNYVLRKEINSETITTPLQQTYSVDNSGEVSQLVVEKPQQRTVVIQSKQETPNQQSLNNVSTAVVSGGGYGYKPKQQISETAVIPYNVYNQVQQQDCIDCGNSQKLELQTYKQQRPQEQCCGTNGYTVVNPQPSIMYQNQAPTLYTNQFTQNKKSNATWWIVGGSVILGTVVGILASKPKQKVGSDPGYNPGTTPKTPINDPPPGGLIAPNIFGNLIRKIFGFN